MPALIRAATTLPEEVEGPMVQTIFALFIVKGKDIFYASLKAGATPDLPLPSNPWHAAHFSRNIVSPSTAITVPGRTMTRKTAASKKLLIKAFQLS
jgi:hypothetical protein